MRRFLIIETETDIKLMRLGPATVIVPAPKQDPVEIYHVQKPLNIVQHLGYREITKEDPL